MDLILTPSSNNLRTGLIKLKQKLNFSSSAPSEPVNQFSYRLPICLQYTRETCVPHLTWDLLNYIPDNDVPVTMGLNSIIDISKVIAKCETNFTNYLPSDFNRPVFLTVQDILSRRRHGFNSPSFVSIWDESGRISFTPSDLIEIYKIIKPNFVQLLSDSDTPQKAAHKRVDKSLQNTISLTKTCLTTHETDWKDESIFGSIEGGWSMEKRLISVENTKLFPVAGFIVDGFLADDLLNDENADELRKIVSKVCANLSKDKVRVLFGPLKPERVVDVVTSGVDMIDSSYCTHLADSSTALLILKKDNLLNVQSSVLNLADDSYQRDFHVIEANCNCYTCSKGFTRAYINHLVKSREMLASILLILHNLSVYYDFINHLQALYEAKVD